MKGPNLRVENLTKKFGPFIAIDDLSFSIENSRITAVIGPNGAGKTTLFNLLTGTLSPNQGHIYFRDEEISGLKSHEIAQRGIARSYQITNFFSEFSVFENVRLASQSNYSTLSLSNILTHHRQVGQSFEDTDAVLREVGLENVRTEIAGKLSHGQQRHLEIGIALASDPELLLLDEPTAGMSPDETTETKELIKAVSQDVPILIVEHDVEVVMSVSDRILVMNQGSILEDGTPDQIRKNREVQRVYLGGGSL